MQKIADKSMQSSRGKVLGIKHGNCPRLRSRESSARTGTIATRTRGKATAIAARITSGSMITPSSVTSASMSLGVTGAQGEQEDRRCQT